MTSAQLGDVTIEYEVDGPDDGEPMLLVMGLGAQLVAWPRDVVEGLVERGFRVIRMDNRDIGLSTKTDAPVPTGPRCSRRSRTAGTPRPTTCSRTWRRMPSRCSTTSGWAAHVVGVSMGGMIAQLTIDHPERVLSLCSIMSNTGNRRTGGRARLLPTMAVSMTTPRPEDLAEAERRGIEGFRLIAGPHFDEDEITVMVRMALARNINPLGTIRQLLAIQASPDRTPGLRGLRVPTLVVHGLLDQLVMPSGGIATARAVPGHASSCSPTWRTTCRAPAGRDRRGDHPERPPGAGRVGRALTASTRSSRPARNHLRQPAAGRPPHRRSAGLPEPGARHGLGIRRGPPCRRPRTARVSGPRRARRPCVDEESDLVLGDDERWGEADRRALRLLGEDAAGHEPLGQPTPAGPTRLDVEPCPDPGHGPPGAPRPGRRAARDAPRGRGRVGGAVLEVASASIVTTSWPMAAASGFRRTSSRATPA